MEATCSYHKAVKNLKLQEEEEEEEEEEDEGHEQLLIAAE